MHPARPPHRHTPRRQTVLLPVAGLVLLAACGLALLAMSTARVGLVAELVGIVAALVPVGSIVAALTWMPAWMTPPAGVAMASVMPTGSLAPHCVSV